MKNRKVIVFNWGGARTQKGYLAEWFEDTFSRSSSAKDKNDPNYYLNTVTRTFSDEGDKSEINNKAFVIQIDLAICCRCFWRIVQKMADSELGVLMVPSDF